MRCSASRNPTVELFKTMAHTVVDLSLVRHRTPLETTNPARR